MHKLEYRSTAG